EGSHRRRSVFSMEDSEREVEILAEVVEREHRRLELIRDVGGAPSLEASAEPIRPVPSTVTFAAISASSASD
ncbi:MAG TPA: hypothetical protein VIN32_03920, partial [Candidatus Limnocylindria bacterium]